MSHQHSHAVVLIDAMEGVRAGIRWILEADQEIRIVGEGSSVAAALRMVEGARSPDVIISGLRLADGVAADLARAGVPVIVHTWLPDDERPAAWTRGCAAVVRHGNLRSGLADAIRGAVHSLGRDPDRDIDSAGSASGSR